VTDTKLVKLHAVGGHVTLIELNRPQRLNAMTFELVAELHDALDVVAADDGCKVAVLTGAGRAFCAGLDLKDWGTVPETGSHAYRPAGSTGQSFMSSLTQHIRDTPQIILAALNGPAYGGGFALALACDLRVAAESSQLCAAFIKTGLTATDIGISYFLPRLIGASRAFDLMLTGRTVDADAAERLGIVSRVFPDIGFREQALDMAHEVAAYTATGLRLTKEVMWANLDAVSLEACLALENRNQDLANHSAEVRTYMEAYREQVTRKS
jgi:enoyl-CoA hydratase